MNAETGTTEICCPPFSPEPWDDKIHDWNEKIFVCDHVTTAFYIPLNFGCVMKRLDKKVKSSGATIPDYLCLSEHTSSWRMNVYLAVNQNIEQAEMATLSGRFYSRVYEGPFKDTGKWCADFEHHVKSKNLKTKKLFMWYTTCPKCAKKYGKNHVVIVSEIAEQA